MQTCWIFRESELYQEHPDKSAGVRGEAAGGTGDPELSIEELYREAALSCFRFLGFTSFDQVDRLTIPEYNLLMQAVRLRQVDLDYRNHLQAFLSFAVQAEKRVGKNKSRPVYRTFQRFYDYDAELQKVLSDREPEDRFAGLKQFLREGGGESG